MDEENSEAVYRRQLRTSHARLGVDEHVKMEEMVYRRMLKAKWARKLGDPLLRSMDSDGTVRRGLLTKEDLK